MAAKKPSANAAPAAQPVQVSLVRNVKHDGVDYVIGELLELGERAAKALIDAGAAVIAGAEKLADGDDAKDEGAAPKDAADTKNE